MCYNIHLMLILASNSPRRSQLLRLGGWDFHTLAPQIDESVRSGEPPADYVLRLAGEKAATALYLIEEGAVPDAIILAADTAVVDPVIPDGPVDSSSILGKPANPAEAEAMLWRLRGRTHQVLTGLVALRASDRSLLTDVSVTEVPMRWYSDDEIRDYIATGDPFDKAGGYAIQHPGFNPVLNLHGCYANVMGLPVCRVSELLTRLGCPPARDVSKECQQQLKIPCQVYRDALRAE